MKKRHLFAFATLCTTVFAAHTMRDNDTKEMLNSKSYNLCRHYDFSGVNTSTTEIHPIVLMKNVDYNINLGNTNVNDVFVVLKDEKGKVIASNHESNPDRAYKRMVFKCNSTRLYSIEITPKNNSKGSCDIAFKKHAI